MDDLINKWEIMRALQAINPVAKLMDGDLVIKISEVENVLENMPSVKPDVPDINVGSIDTTTHDSIPAETGKNDGDKTSGDCISRQQAIDALKELTANGTNKGMVFGEDAVHRIEMLPSIQPDPCEDAVSREAVLSMIDTYMNKSVELHYLPTSDGIKKLISILPPAKPERPKGRWIPTASGKGRHECS